MRVIVKKDISDSGYVAYRIYREKKGIFGKKMVWVDSCDTEEQANKRAEHISNFDGSIVSEYINGVKQ